MVNFSWAYSIRLKLWGPAIYTSYIRRCSMLDAVMSLRQSWETWRLREGGSLLDGMLLTGLPSRLRPKSHLTSKVTLTRLLLSSTAATPTPSRNTLPFNTFLTLRTLPDRAIAKPTAPNRPLGNALLL